MRTPLAVILIVAAAVVACCCGSAGAWSFKDHILVTRLAVQRLLADPQLPADLRQFLQAAEPAAGTPADAEHFLVRESVGANPPDLKGLDYWCVFPDRARDLDGNKPVAPFGVPEALMHFIDLELLKPAGDDGVQQYRDDLSGKPTLDQLPRDFRDPRLVQAGFLPYRVEQVYGDLVKAVRDKRLMPKADADRDNALVLTGYLAHYLADNTQPQHATLDYKSLSYFDDTRRAPNVHGMLEYGLIDWAGHEKPALRQELWDKIAAELARMDAARSRASVAPFVPFRDVAAMSLWSYDALPLIGRAAQAAAGQPVQNDDPTRPVGPPARKADDFDLEAFYHFRGTVGGQEMSVLDLKARQFAVAVTRVEAAIRQAWREAGE